MKSRYDVAVVGGGIVGMSTAMALASRGRSVVVLDAADRLAAHQSGHNSGVIHAGLYYRPGSLKARLCAEGREALYRFCAEHDVPHRRCGKLVVATVDEFESRIVEALSREEKRVRVDLERVSTIDSWGLGTLMRAGAPYTLLKGAIYIHPTLAEGFYSLMDAVKPA